MAYLLDDASSEYIEFYIGAQSYSIPWTLACWFNADAFPSSGTMLSIGDSAGSQLQMIQINSSAQVQCLSVDGSWNIAGKATTATVSANTWHHCAGVFATNMSRSIYLDGANKQSDTGISNLDGTYRHVDIGRRAFSGGGEHFSGMIAEAVIYADALTDAEIAALATGISPLAVRPQNIFSYIPLVRSLRDPVTGWEYTAYNTPVVADHPRVLYQVGPYVGVYAAAAASGITPKAMYYKRLRA